MNKIVLLIIIFSLFLYSIGNVNGMSMGRPGSNIEMDTKTSMSEREAYVTNRRYINEDIPWGRPKGVLYGNFPGAGKEQKANLFPDKSATYFVMNICMSPGWVLVLNGQYPHARYFSLTIADQLGSGQLGNGYFARGDQIVPDAGSLNPFLSQNNRNVTNRNYTFYVVHGFPEGNPPDNTLYTYSTDENKRIHFSIRIYLVDRGYDGTGNVKLRSSGYGLPEISLNLPEGKIVAGSNLTKILRVVKDGDPNGYQLNQWLSNIDNSDDKKNAPCLPMPFFQLFWNTEYSVTGSFLALHPKERVTLYPADDVGGFANNPDTKYMITPFSFGFGEILVVRGKMPTHPKTRKGNNNLPGETPQVQYFSVSTAAAAPYGAGWETISDEQMPIDKYGYYTIVVSWPWNRPANAILENDVSWINPGDGEGHYVGARNWVGLLYMRFQNPDPNWEESPANIRMPTVENPIPQDPAVMDQFYPIAEYMSVDNFEGNW